MAALLEKVIAAVVETLNLAEVPAAPAYVKQPLDDTAAFVRVGVKRVSEAYGVGAQYLGILHDAEHGDREVYGLQCEIELSVDVYAPFAQDNGALVCTELFDSAALAIGAVEGLKLKALSCGAPAPEETTGMFLLRGSMLCSAWLVAEQSGEAGTFTDFILKGELKK